MPCLSLLLSLLVSPVSASCLQEARGDFTIEGDHVTDRKSGLTWKRCALGMQWNAQSQQCTGLPAAFNQNEAKQAAQALGDQWRLPSGAELETLLMETCSGHQIDPNAFPNISASDEGEGAKFWTSTPAMAGMFYYFDLLNGYADMHSSGFSLSVLPVKGG